MRVLIKTVPLLFLDLRRSRKREDCYNGSRSKYYEDSIAVCGKSHQRVKSVAFNKTYRAFHTWHHVYKLYDLLKFLPGEGSHRSRSKALLTRALQRMKESA